MAAFIHSATVIISDPDKAIEFYTTKLGWEKVEDFPLGEAGRWIVVVPPGEKTGIALLTPQFMAMGGDVTSKPGGHTGISIVTDNVQAMYDELVAKGVKFTQPVQQMPWGAPGTWFDDQDGNNYFLTTPQH